MKLTFISHGLKTLHTGTLDSGTHRYLLPKADLYIDCRVLMDVDGGRIRDSGGRLRGVVEMAQPVELDRIEGLIRAGLHLIPTRRRNSPPDRTSDPVVICFMCAWGLNRSPTCKAIMGERLSREFEVEVR